MTARSPRLVDIEDALAALTSEQAERMMFRNGRHIPVNLARFVLSQSCSVFF
jgi:hypothetical protein